MKKIVVLILLAISLKGIAQNAADTNFVTVITAANWMPDGKALLLNIVKFDKTPLSVVFQLIETNKE